MWGLLELRELFKEGSYMRKYINLEFQLAVDYYKITN